VSSCFRAGSSTTLTRFLELLRGLGDDAEIALEAFFFWEWVADVI